MPLDKAFFLFIFAPSFYTDKKILADCIEHNQVREVGAEWLCKQTMERLDIDKCLCEWLRRNTALAEKITRRHLYKVSRMLYRDKGVIEKHLSVRTGELFASEDKILLYDLTNTYFEGRKTSSEKALFGPSKEKRFDAKLIYVSVSLSKMKNFEPVDSTISKVELQDNRENKIFVQWVKVEGKEDNILYVKSESKQIKESSMEE